MVQSAVGEEKHDSITSYSSEDPKRIPPGFLAQINTMRQPISDTLTKRHQTAPT